MARRGRKRNALAKREPSGRIAKTARTPVVEKVTPTVQQLRRRAIAFGSIDAPGELDNPLDILHAREIVTSEHAKAGSQFAALYYAAAGQPFGPAMNWRDFVQCDGAPGRDRRATVARYRDADAALSAAGHRARAVVVMVAVERKPLRQSHKDDLENGLEALRRFFAAEVDRRNKTVATIRELQTEEIAPARP